MWGLVTQPPFCDLEDGTHPLRTTEKKDRSPWVPGLSTSRLILHCGVSALATAKHDPYSPADEGLWH
jgi:hypothetical protein